MATPVEIKDNDSDRRAKVTSYGQLVVSPIEYSIPSSVDMTLTGTAYNLVTPRSGRNIVITDVIASAGKTVSNTTPADVRLFTADGVNSNTPIETLLRPQLLRAGNFITTGLNLLVGPGLWVNANTDDQPILLTVMYYYIPSPR